MTQVLASAGGVLGQIGANIAGGPPGTEYYTDTGTEYYVGKGTALYVGTG